MSAAGILGFRVDDVWEGGVGGGDVVGHDGLQLPVHLVLDQLSALDPLPLHSPVLEPHLYL